MFVRYLRLLLDPTTTTEGGSTTTAQTPPPEKKSDGFEALAAKHSSDGIGLARDLYGQLQAANARVSELSGKVPADGAIVLAGDDAKAWGKYRNLGKPDEIKTQLDEGTTARGEVAKYARERAVSTVAKAAGFDPDVLGTLAGELEFEVADETVKGKPAKVAYVKDGDKKTPLDKYAEANWPKFLPSLRQAEAPKPLGTPPGRSTTLPRPEPQGERAKERILPLGRF